MADNTDNGLVGKVVMAFADCSVQVGILERDDPPTLARDYLTITGGAGVEPNIRINSKPGIVHGTLKLYNSGSLAGDLQKYRCQGVQVSQLVANMVQGAYGEQQPAEPDKEDSI